LKCAIAEADRDASEY
jgi:hypothetical protein